MEGESRWRLGWACAMGARPEKLYGLADPRAHAVSWSRVPRKWEEAMIRKVFWSLAIVMLACSSGKAADIRRVVTGLDTNNKAIALFDSRLTLKPGGSG